MYTDPHPAPATSLEVISPGYLKCCLWGNGLILPRIKLNPWLSHFFQTMSGLFEESRMLWSHSLHTCFHYWNALLPGRCIVSPSLLLVFAKSITFSLKHLLSTLIIKLQITSPLMPKIKISAPRLYFVFFFFAAFITKWHPTFWFFLLSSSHSRGWPWG